MNWQDVQALVDFYRTQLPATPITITGDDAANTLTGDASGNGIDGRGGNDTIDGAAGDDLLLGGDGNDTVSGSAGRDLLIGGAGNDKLQGGDDVDVVSYADAAEGVNVNLTSGAALGGASSGTDRLFSIQGAIGAFWYSNTLIGDVQDNILIGGIAQDYLHGGDGTDILGGGGGGDTLIGGRGGDFFFGGGQVVIQGDLYGGPDDPGDWVLYTGLNVSVTVDLLNNKTFGGAAGDILFNVENLVGTEFQDTLIGNHEANILHALGGGGSLSGHGGDDVLIGGNGGDGISGGAGNDELTGDIGQDGLAGGDGDDVLDGGADADTLHGDAGNDRLTGGTGTDFLHGDAGDDEIEGGSAHDELYGGDGNDVLTGGASFDYLTGGAGQDQFVFDNGEVKGDQVFDFAITDDVMVVSGFTGLDSFDDMQGRLFQVGDDVVVKLDADDSALLHDTTVASLTSGNFLFV
jgi:Ca2+-binding RTX toxin-like protein